MLGRRREVRRAGGCGFADNPERDATHARMIWRPEFDRGVVTVDALPTAVSDPASLDIRRVGLDVTLFAVPGELRQLLLSDGNRHIHLALREGDFLNGPVRLRYALEGMVDLEPKLLTLRRLAGLSRLGRMPRELFPRDRRASRWIEMLRTLDAIGAGASHRDIARILYGCSTVRRDWRTQSDYLRLRVQRLVRGSEIMARQGYLGLVTGEYRCASIASHDAGR